jgi:hypothetical protein
VPEILNEVASRPQNLACFAASVGRSVDRCDLLQNTIGAIELIVRDFAGGIRDRGVPKRRASEVYIRCPESSCEKFSRVLVEGM